MTELSVATGSELEPCGKSAAAARCLSISVTYPAPMPRRGALATLNRTQPAPSM
jgi:hypothetical protein